MSTNFAKMIKLLLTLGVSACFIAGSGCRAQDMARSGESMTPILKVFFSANIMGNLTPCS